MTEPPVVDMAMARQLRARKNRGLAEFALTQCEQAYFCNDWALFDYWLQIYRYARRRSPVDRQNIVSYTPSNLAQHLRPETPCGASDPASRGTAVATCLAKVAAALLLLTIAAPSPAKTMSYSSSDKATVIASTTVSDITAVPLYVKLIGGRLPPDAISCVESGSGFFYQLSGTTEILVGGKTTTISAGDATFVAAGAEVTLKAGNREPSIYLEFLLAPNDSSDLPGIRAMNGREIYRSNLSIRGLHNGAYVLNLTKVTLPRQAPPDMPHHRSAAALHVVLSGLGAETRDGTTLTYQWRNPGNETLTYLVFNLNGEAEDAVVAADREGPPR